MKRILVMAAEQEELDAAIAAYNGCRGQLKNIAEVKFMLCGIGAVLHMLRHYERDLYGSGGREAL